MQFSDTTNKNGIIQNCESLCNLGDAGISGNATLLAKFVGFINQSNQRVASALMQVDKRWIFDDSNYTDFPRGAGTLVANQKDYTLPAATISGDASTLLSVVKIAVLDNNSTPQERVLTLTDWDESALNNAYVNPGLPTVYKLVSNSIKMWPAPTSTYCTLASGLIVYFKRTPVPFTTSSTTTQPGFMSSFHDILQLEASGQYLLPTNAKLAETYLVLASTRLDELQSAVAHENEDSKTRILFKRRSSR